MSKASPEELAIGDGDAVPAMRAEIERSTGDLRDGDVADRGVFGMLDRQTARAEVLKQLADAGDVPAFVERQPQTELIGVRDGG